MGRLNYTIIALFLFNSTIFADETVLTNPPKQTDSIQQQDTEQNVTSKSESAEETEQGIAINLDDKSNGNDEYADYATVKLSPIPREEEVSNNKYNINVEDILPLLRNVVFFDKVEQFKNLPFVYNYIEDGIIGGTGSQFFVKGTKKFNNNVYTFLRNKSTYKHPDTGEILGTEFVAIGTAKIVERNKEATKMEVINSTCPVEIGDKIVARIDLSLPAFLHGTIPDKKMQGYILDVEDGLWDMGKYHNVLVSLGSRDGIEQGHILKILRMNYRKDLLAGRNYKKKRMHKKPSTEFSSTKYGELVIYKVFDKVSLGLVVEARFPITVLDVVESGEQTS
jgi:ribosomal protein L30E